MKYNREALTQRVEQLEQFRADVQAICESGKNRTKHTQLQMCAFLDGLRIKALETKSVMSGESSAAELQSEIEARAIYERWAGHAGFVPWIDGGNSTMQERARALARQGCAEAYRNNVATC